MASEIRFRESTGESQRPRVFDPGRVGIIGQPLDMRP